MTGVQTCALPIYDSEGVNIFVVIAVVVVLVVVVIEVMAFVVLKKPRDSVRGRRRGSNN